MKLVEKMKNGNLILFFGLAILTISGCESSYMKITGRKAEKVSQDKRLPRDNQEYIEYAGRDNIKSNNKRKVYTEDSEQYNDIFSQKRDMYPQRLAEYKETLKKIELGQINNYSKTPTNPEEKQANNFYSKLLPLKEEKDYTKPLENTEKNANNDSQNLNNAKDNEYTQRLKDHSQKSSKVNLIDVSSLDAENKAKQQMIQQRHSKEALKTIKIPQGIEEVRAKIKDDDVLKQTKNILVNNITVEKADANLPADLITRGKPQKRTEEVWTEEQILLKPDDIRSYR